MSSDAADDRSRAAEDVVLSADEPISGESGSPVEGVFPEADSPLRIVVEARAHGWRVDHYLCRLFPNFSRASWQRTIAEEGVKVNNLPTKSGWRLRVNDILYVTLPEEPQSELVPENIPLDILYEDEFLVALNKPWGLIVHPGRGNPTGTLASALQYHFDQLSDVAGRFRPGIVHRLDKDTSGVLVVAKSNQIHDRLTKQWEERTVEKEYRAIVWGSPHYDSDWIETHMRVHPKVREKMQVCRPDDTSRHAATFYEVVERFDGYSQMKLNLKTGRTHQLRVHMQHLGHSIVADKVYGGKGVLLLSDVDQSVRPETPADHPLIHRQALHASRLTIAHPQTGRPMTFEAPLPADMANVLETLRRTNS
ncbi:MAG: RluA family pseudouridine synthase [Planctomycetaceae bacterium]